MEHRYLIDALNCWRNAIKSETDETRGSTIAEARIVASGVDGNQRKLREELVEAAQVFLREQGEELPKPATDFWV